MTKEKVTEILRDLINEHNPTNETWDISFNNKKKTLGSCHYSERTIWMSTYYMERISDEEIIDTCKHEVAHLMAFYKGSKGHDWIWKEQCSIVGCTPERLKNVGNIHECVSICKYCGKISTRIRMPKRDVSCGYCGNGKYNEKYQLTYNYMKIDDYKVHSDIHGYRFIKLTNNEPKPNLISLNKVNENNFSIIKDINVIKSWLNTNPKNEQLEKILKIIEKS